MLGPFVYNAATQARNYDFAKKRGLKSKQCFVWRMSQFENVLLKHIYSSLSQAGIWRQSTQQLGNFYVQFKFKRLYFWLKLSSLDLTPTLGHCYRLVSFDEMNRSTALWEVGWFYQMDSVSRCFTQKSNNTTATANNLPVCIRRFFFIYSSIFYDLQYYWRTWQLLTKLKAAFYKLFTLFYISKRLLMQFSCWKISLKGILISINCP